MSLKRIGKSIRGRADFREEYNKTKSKFFIRL
jgi:hypothetical protein